ncbi:hypothetical protein Ancab_004516 [Ancistrocladus abbreviatus]
MTSRRHFPATGCPLWSVLLVLVLHFLALASARRSTGCKSPWQTLNGSAPLVVARGGFSGLFPDSSLIAYEYALLTSVSNVILWCDVQLTKDGDGICFPYLTLDNSSDISANVKAKQSRYDVNGVPLQGYFTIDFTVKDLATVYLTQGIYNRCPNFDSTFPVMTVASVFKQITPPGFWLNIQHDAFFSQHNLSMRSFVLGASKNVIVSYISSPEVNFLQGLAKPFASTKTKLVFRFLDQDETETSTKQTYSSLLKNLTFIKTFASGILVPKSYIWPAENLYLQPHTSIVTDAHKIGLEVFAAGFANDFLFAYNYSYNPVAEYLSFIDNGDFSVDGLLSDFPITASEAIECFAHIGQNATGKATPLVISYNGASGDYPGCTDIAYTKAISDGADVIDCNVQISKDGIPFCLSSINLIDSTTVDEIYSSRTTMIPELQKNPGIFSFNLTWSEIQRLKPVISNPYQENQLYRNPNFKHAGKLESLSEFLALAQNATSPSGVLIRIEHAFYLAENLGLSVTDAVLEVLNKAGYNRKMAKKVMIQSQDRSVLAKFKGKNYELVYEVDEIIHDILMSAILEIKNFSDSVVIKKRSVYPEEGGGFMTNVTDIVRKLQSFKLLVYVELFRNEFLSPDWDFFSDPIVEINQFVVDAGVDGLVTEFPQTAVSYKKNRCLNSENRPAFTKPVPPGGLLSLMSPAEKPPAEAPAPVLTDADVSEPALPPAVKIAPSPASPTPVAFSPNTPSCALPGITLSVFLPWLGVAAAVLLLF